MKGTKMAEDQDTGLLIVADFNSLSSKLITKSSHEISWGIKW